jgi:hypothetical protein
LLVSLVKAERPVAGRTCAVAVNQQAKRCWQPAHLAKDGAWRGDHVEVQVVEDRLRIKLVAVPLNAVGTIRESQRLAISAITQGLDCEAVNSQESACTRRINDCQGVGSSDMRGDVHAALVPGFQDGCGRPRWSRNAGPVGVLQGRRANHRADGTGVSRDIVTVKSKRVDQFRPGIAVEEAGQVDLAR